MKVLLAASEVSPIIKIGGLGDVIGSLPKALEKINVDADVVVPFYPSAKTNNLKLYKTFDLNVPFNGQNNVVEIFKTKLPGSNVDVHLLRNAQYFEIGGKNAFLNNIKETEMFSFFSKAVVEYIKTVFNTYDVIHCHDWHTGLLTHLLSSELHEERPKTLFTIHNIFYQGKADTGIVREVGFIPGEHPLIDFDIEDGDLNLLYQGITSSDYVSTVSESYAQEIQTKEFGGELYETMQARKDRLIGILNGLDYSYFPRHFSKNTWQQKKPELKKALQKKLGLEVGDKPIFSFVSRLDPGQKGLDILYVSVERILQNEGQFVLLGVGDPVWEKKFKDLLRKKEFAKNVSINTVFDVDLALEIYEGSTFFIAPSKYEPCGLTQMIAMHYGTVPIVRNVGGLKDTVINGENGFVFNKYSSSDLNKKIDLAFDLHKNETDYKQMVVKCLESDFSWDVSAQKYKDLYEKICS